MSLQEASIQNWAHESCPKYMPKELRLYFLWYSEFELKSDKSMSGVILLEIVGDIIVWWTFYAYIYHRNAVQEMMKIVGEETSVDGEWFQFSSCNIFSWAIK